MVHYVDYVDPQLKLLGFRDSDPLIQICVETQIGRMGRRVMEFTYVIRNERGVIAEGRTVHVVVGPDGRPKSLPDRYADLLQKHVQKSSPGKRERT